MERKTKKIIGVLSVAILVPTILVLGSYNRYTTDLDAFTAQVEIGDSKIRIYNTALTCVSINKCSLDDLNKTHTDLYQQFLKIQRELNNICAKYSIHLDDWCDDAKTMIDIRLKMLDEGKPIESELQQVSKINS